MSLLVPSIPGEFVLAWGLLLGPTQPYNPALEVVEPEGYVRARARIEKGHPPRRAERNGTNHLRFAP